MYREVIGSGALLLALMACSPDQSETALELPADEEAGPVEDTTPDVAPARAVFHNQMGTEIGVATLTQQGDAVRVQVDLAFLQAGERGFHFHEVGACDLPDFESAGNHFNPTDGAHGSDDPAGPHAGDLPNLEVETDDGTASGAYTNDAVTLVPDLPNSLLDADGASLIVHQDADDYSTQPDGDAGGRQACAVIEVG